ncbi:MAG: DUF6530 family protein [Bacteroidales bacterium]|nr:DUF6530 family protein [Bacteroidales bacterium]
MFVIEERKWFRTDRKKEYYKHKKTIMESPKHLKHHPIVSVNDYDQIDGQYYNQDTDARALSIGEATWDNEHISLKVWRRPDERWSRQSEELPIHRCLDLAILFLACLKKDKNLPYPTCSLPLTIDDKTKFDTIRSFYENASNKKHIVARLNELRNLLNEWFEREGGLK